MSESEHSTTSNSSKTSRAVNQTGEVQPPLTHVTEQRTNAECSRSGTEDVPQPPRSSGFIPPPLTTEFRPGQCLSSSSDGEFEGRPATLGAAKLVQQEEASASQKRARGTKEKKRSVNSQ